jgi:hypothetical protein
VNSSFGVLSFNGKEIMRKHKTSIERFEDKIDKSGECWMWVGSKTKGYGQIRVDGKTVRAHRFAYEAYVGEIPNGFLVCHSCDVPSCVNPDHLFLGTNADNLADCGEKGRQSRGERHNTAKLSESQVGEIRSIYPLKTQKELAEMFGVYPSAICKIVNRKTWKHI